MATLTSTEIARIRDIIGDSFPTTGNKHDLTDTEIQAEWDRANGHNSEQNEYRAYYYMLIRRYGIWMNQVDTQTEQGTSLQSQKLKSIKQALDMYKELAGIGSFTLPVTSGVFDFGLDQDDPITGADLDE